MVNSNGFVNQASRPSSTGQPWTPEMAPAADDRLARMVVTTPPKRPATPGYQPRERIGTPWGELVYVGLRGDDGFYWVRSRTTYYRIAPGLTSRDEIRAWAFSAIQARTITTPLYIPNASSVGGAGVVGNGAGRLPPEPMLGARWVTYMAGGHKRPLSHLAKLTSPMVLSKLPKPAAEFLKRLAPFLTDPKSSDLLSIEVNTSLQGEQAKWHFKFNLAKFLDLDQVVARQILGLMRQLIPKNQGMVLGTLEKLLGEGKKPGFSGSAFAKSGDFRFTLEGKNLSNLRLGLKTLPGLPQFKKAKDWLEFVISPRVKFDHRGRIEDVEMYCAFEAQIAETRQGFFSGLRTGAMLRWNGDVRQSPFRVNASGRLGVEFQLGGTRMFVPVPGAAQLMTTLGLGDPSQVPVSDAPGVNAAVLARQLKINDPTLIRQLEEYAASLQDVGNLAEKAGGLAGNVSSFMTVAGPFLSGVGGGSLVGKLGKAGAVLGGALLLNGTVLARPVESGSLNGPHLYSKYKNETSEALITMARHLNMAKQRDRVLTPEERYELKAAFVRFENISNRWQQEPTLIKLYKQLPEREKALWSSGQVEQIRKAVEQEINPRPLRRDLRQVRQRMSM